MASSTSQKICVIVFTITIVCIIVVGVVVSIVLSTLLNDGHQEDTGSFVSTSGKYQNAAVASDAALCSEVGAKILFNGGSAVDGAIATIFCLSVVNCHSTGIGGGGFMVIHQNNNSENPIVIDFREVAPSDATKHMYDENEDLSRKGK